MPDSNEYLGHVLNKNGIHMSTKKVKAIVEMLQPKDQKHLRAFQGMVNYYGKFMPHLSEFCVPLNHLLQKAVRWKWTKECEEATYSQH